LVTISHRPALFRYHQHLLRLTGENGAWETETIGTKEQQLSLEKEIQALQNQLNEVEGMKSRLQAIDTELSLKM
jgi:ATP-binding cassette subfamily D (ALD) long-chain fatty acid import protein